uniref:Uncharacterized protein n=1 Tax=Timema poppense TaxID=170557 RepID=A0A7R9CV81_TIMPO|nr:unnamed protein product [Timema poppensis]
MRVQEKSSASCAKMTEERSVNGGLDGPSESNRGFALANADGSQSPNLTGIVDNDKSNSVAAGRLKFFKDGKFILELSHRKEGDRTSWAPVSVSKRTCWPPVPSTIVGTPRQESSTSLSVSDDNSSVQSSPWQRDHSWKQSVPRRGVGTEMTFYMRPSRHAMHVRNLPSLRRKRRCPHDPTEAPVSDKNQINSVGSMRVKRAGRLCKLSVLVQQLWDQNTTKIEGTSPLASTSALNHVRTATVPSVGRLDPSIVSPRKRILREMERVSLEDLANSNKRQRATGALVTNSVPCQIPTGPLATPQPSPLQATSKCISSYSITSLLSRDEEPSPAHEGSEPSFLRTLLRSPQHTPSPEPSPRQRATPVSRSRKSSPTTSPAPGLPRAPPLVPSMGASPHPLTPFLTPSLFYTPYLPHSAPPPPYYTALPPATVSSLWAHYSLSNYSRGAGLYPGMIPTAPVGPCPWGGPIAHQPLEELKKEEASSELKANTRILRSGPVSPLHLLLFLSTNVFECSSELIKARALKHPVWMPLEVHASNIWRNTHSQGSSSESDV